jgi:hypothetical protein
VKVIEIVIAGEVGGAKTNPQSYLFVAALAAF